ncbi:probable alpha,alpha-trehalose-phosphate synthase [UDP-forming] 9 isoform X1 [Ziziphus jujuba]|uniref:Probable alpha,alpha-trehalose-phosphate synthase [UDP-forming] 9 isoform X1 n=2 Tax=Ziziphus jujuba TaxID=326968 RepID=A0A6P3ZVB2_ZIZJJ|nr:probable alpha,alpha-trehalose-phosphate synthase [UDP-forming] 9 isoform X1 [Ziziphus jujuba]
MISRSCLDLLNLISFDDVRPMSPVPRIMNMPGVISEFRAGLHDNINVVDEESVKNSGSDLDSSNTPQERRIIVANELPIRAYRDPDSKKWCFEFDKDKLALQLKDAFGTDVDVYYVGCLKADIEGAAEQEEVAQVLHDKFRCVPTFLPTETQNKFYHGFCKHYLWPLFHYMLPLLKSHGQRFDNAEWQAYVSANKAFADKIIGVINSDQDSVWIHDYHLMVVPAFLRKRFYRVKLGFFLHSPFPTSEIYRTLPVREEILRSLLNCDLIGFHTFDYARHFLSSCSRLLGMDYELKRGYIGLEYYGRTVSIKIKPAGIHMGQLKSALSQPDTVESVIKLRRQFKDKTVILGVDDMDLFKGISLKFLAMGKLLDQNPHWRGKVVLIQIANPARSSGEDVQSLQKETSTIVDEINHKYGEEAPGGYKPIIFIKRPVTSLEKAAFYAIAECCVVNAVRDGMNLVPYMYTVCRQGSSVLDKALGVIEEGSDSSPAPKQSVIIVSEFIGCSPSLSGAIRVNPWNIEAVSDAMNSAITMSEEEKRLRHEKHYKYISSHDVAYWARSFDQDLERACKEHYNKRFWGMGFGLGFRVMALGPNFRKLSLDYTASVYRNTTSRLILLDCDGTIMPKMSVDQAPSAEIISVLNTLCGEPKNTVFIVSGRGKDSLSKWFAPCENLGISSEHGYFTRWNGNSPWEVCTYTKDFDWKNIALPVMEHYTEATDGSHIEQKETALVWHHQVADPHFGSCQAKELHDHLENVLANEPVVVKRGKYIVEVKPQGVSKGKVVESIVLSMQINGKTPDFVLCIGDDRSDEDMFESIGRSISGGTLPATAEVFACTVGQKPSTAKYFVEGSGEVVKLLQLLGTVPEQPPRYTTAQHQEAFQGFD